MICPILQAGIMLTGVTLKTYNASSYGENFNQFSSESAVCMKERCEWYGCGCPAYPTNIDIRHKRSYEKKEKTDVKGS